jgi:NIMA (never in mitosis gene a)-related kinase
MLNLSEREKENALNEVRILASIKHKNVAAYKEAFFDEQSSSLW